MVESIKGSSNDHVGGDSKSTDLPNGEVESSGYDNSKLLELIARFKKPGKVAVISGDNSDLNELIQEASDSIGTDDGAYDNSGVLDVIDSLESNNHPITDTIIAAANGEATTTNKELLEVVDIVNDIKKEKNKMGRQLDDATYASVLDGVLIRLGLDKLEPKYKFGKTSTKRRSTIRWELQIIADISLYFIDSCVICGERSLEDQLAAYNAGNSSVKKGKHNSSPSDAMDMGWWNPTLKNIDYGMNQSNNYSGKILMLADIIFGEGHVVAGNDWDNDDDINDHKLKDPLHFQWNGDESYLALGL